MNDRPERLARRLIYENRWANNHVGDADVMQGSQKTPFTGLEPRLFHGAVPSRASR